MNDLPPSLDLRRLGLDPARIGSVTLLQEKHGNALYRVRHAEASYILKCFGDPASAVEPRAYALLRTCGVPVLPVYGQTEDALLLEDLQVSPSWRLAEAADVESIEAGVAIADWYRALHGVGARALSGPADARAFLQGEVDALDAERILDTGARLAPAGGAVWSLAAEHIEALKVAWHTLPQTLTYNDFHWTNLALSRRSPLSAIVFDYHLLGVGPAFSDCRNVEGSLGEGARRAFREAYGPVDERGAVLDAPLATLYALYVAAQRPVAGLAESSLAHARDGTLERDLRRALDSLR